MLKLFDETSPLVSELFALSLSLARFGIEVRRHGPTIAGRETIEYKRNGILLATIKPYVHDERVLEITAPLTFDLEAIIRRHAIVSFLVYAE